MVIFISAVMMSLSGKSEAQQVVSVNAYQSPVREMAPRSDSASCPDYWASTGFTRSDIRNAWRSGGRHWLELVSRLRWDSTAKSWTVNTSKPEGADIAHDAYNLEFVLDPAVEAASILHDRELLDELADFFVKYSDRFASTESLRRSGKVLKVPGDGPGVRILPWPIASGGQVTINECLVCTVQFMFPASRLLRIIAALPQKQRDQTLESFVNVYSKLLVQGDAMRLLTKTNRNFWRAPDLDSSYIRVWQQLARVTPEQRHANRYAVADIDLLLIGSTAELLAANRLSPRDVMISHKDRVVLEAALHAGVSAVRSRMDRHPETTDFSGGVVGSIGLFEGEFDDQSDYDYAGDTTAILPRVPHRRVGTSWDVSHGVRIPRVIRALAETAPQTGVSGFSPEEVTAIDNQFVYRVFDGAWSQPRLTNFFDGSDGWYRVGYHGPGSGYPPSRYCDSRPPMNRPCLETTSFVGWGLIASEHDGLCRLEASVARLARETEGANRDFADRYLTFLGESFRVPTGGRGAYPTLLFAILADNVRQLR